MTTQNNIVKSETVKVELYPLEYRATRCLKCAKLLTEHRRFTQADIDESAGATYHNPINGHYAPLSPTLIGQWQHHEPMPWKLTEQEQKAWEWEQSVKANPPKRVF